MHDQMDPAQVAPYLAYRPLDIVKATLEYTTQLARMIIRKPLRRHYKARNPGVNVTRIDEAVSTDPMFANCSSLHHGHTGAQVFYGTTSEMINVYGFRKPRNFPRMYKDFIRENGAPSLLRRDNAKDEQSEEVQEIQRTYMIKDGFSEPDHPHQNPVESKAIKWLKQASHVLLDRSGAPDSAWFFAVKYLANIHNICYHPKLKMTPYQKRHGVTPDISAYLQFKFWERVLYLDNESSWPESKERAGYWVGVAHNVGDALTYYIYDDQMKCLLARSVVRPYHSNHRVKWDPALAEKELRHTARNGGDIMPSKALRDQQLADSMDEYDKLVPEPEERYFDARKDEQPNISIVDNDVFYDTGFDASDSPLTDVTPDDYKGESKLKYDAKPMVMHPDIKTPTADGKTSYKNIKYRAKFIPKETDPYVEIPGKGEQKTPKDVPEHPGVNTRPPEDDLRRSGRLKDKKVTYSQHAKTEKRTTWKPVRWSKLYALGVLLVGTMFLPTHVTSEPVGELRPQSTKLTDLGLTKEFKEPNTKALEELRVYHYTLDRLNALMFPDAEDERWSIDHIEKHLFRDREDGKREIYVKVQYSDGPKAYLPLTEVRLHDPMVVARYAILRRIIPYTGWEWVLNYINESPVRHALHVALKLSTEDGKRYKFGVQVPDNPKHAIRLDKEQGMTGWQDSMDLEIKQLNDYKTFIVIPDGEPVPPGYQKIPYQFVHDVKFDGRLKSCLVA